MKHPTCISPESARCYLTLPLHGIIGSEIFEEFIYPSHFVAWPVGYFLECLQRTWFVRRRNFHAGRRVAGQFFSQGASAVQRCQRMYRSLAGQDVPIEFRQCPSPIPLQNARQLPRWALRAEVGYGRYGDKDWQQTYDNGGLVIVDKLPDGAPAFGERSEEHTSELQSRE